MSLNYKLQNPYTLVGSKTDAGVLTQTLLTSAYTGNSKVINGVAGMSKLNVNFSYTTGSGESNNSLDVLIEQSNDGVNYFAIVNETVSAGVSTINDRTFSYADNTGGGTNKKSSIGLDIFYKYVKVSFKETGVATNFGTLYAEAVVLGR